jgi:hypothetical protein
MVLRLSGNDHLRLERAAGATIEVLAGRVWVTESGRPEDSFVGAAQRYRVGGNGLVVVSSEGARAELCVTRRSAA